MMANLSEPEKVLRAELEQASMSQIQLGNKNTDLQQQISELERSLQSTKQRMSLLLKFSVGKAVLVARVEELESQLLKNKEMFGMLEQE